MPVPKIPGNCRGCAFAGDPPDGTDPGDWMHCYRLGRLVRASDRCAQGVPVKVGSGRLKRRAERECVA